MTREEAKKVFEYLEKKANTQEPCEVSEYDKDHIWYKGKQYISLHRFLEVKAEAEQEPICDRDCEHCTWTECPIEPCDAISREDAEQMFRNIRSHLKPQDYKSAEEFNTRDLMLLNAEQMIHALPSVTQKSGKGSDKE